MTLDLENIPEPIQQNLSPEKPSIEKKVTGDQNWHKAFCVVVKMPCFQELRTKNPNSAIRLMNTLSKPGFLKTFEEIIKEARFQEPQTFQELCEILNLADTLGIPSLNRSGEQPAFNLNDVPVKQERLLELQAHLVQYPENLELLHQYAFKIFDYWSSRLEDLFPINCERAAFRMQLLYMNALDTLIDKLIIEVFEKEKEEVSLDLPKILTLAETLQVEFIDCHSESSKLIHWKANTIQHVQKYFEKTISENYPSGVATEDHPRPRYLDPAVAKAIEDLESSPVFFKPAVTFLLEYSDSVGILKRRKFGNKWIEVSLDGPPRSKESHTLIHELCHFLTAVARRPHLRSTILGFHLQNLARTAQLSQQNVDCLLEYSNEVLARKIFFGGVPTEMLENRLEESNINPFGYSVLVRIARDFNQSLGLTDEDFVRALLFWEGRRDLETKLHKKGLTLEQYAIELTKRYTTKIKN